MEPRSAPRAMEAIRVLLRSPDGPDGLIGLVSSVSSSPESLRGVEDASTLRSIIEDILEVSDDYEARKPQIKGRSERA